MKRTFTKLRSSTYGRGSIEVIVIAFALIGLALMFNTMKFKQYVLQATSALGAHLQTTVGPGQE